MATRFEAIRDCVHRGTYWNGREQSRNGKGGIYEWRPGHGAPSTHMEALDPIPPECQALIDEVSANVEAARQKAKAKAGNPDDTALRMAEAVARKAQAENEFLRLELEQLKAAENSEPKRARPSRAKSAVTPDIDPLT